MGLELQSCLHGKKIKSWPPAQMMPEGLTLGICGIDHDRFFKQSMGSQLRNRAVHQGPSDPAPAMLWINSKMLDVAAPAIRPSENSADKTAINDSNRANSETALKKCRQHFRRLIQSQTYAFCVSSEFKRRRYMCGSHRSDRQNLLKSHKLAFAHHGGAGLSIAQKRIQGHGGGILQKGV